MLELSGLSVSFGVTPALRDVAMRIDAGEAVSVLGANGAGKTTLLRAIMRRVPFAAGSLRIAGEEAAHLATDRVVRRGVALCPEGRQLFQAMTVEDNLRLGAYGVAAGLVRSRLETILDRVPWLRARRRQLAGSFSGGEQQIVAICRSLMAAPRLLLLDEPSSGLSPIAIGQIREILRTIAGEGDMTMLLVEQNVSLATALTTRCYVLNRGVIESQGATATLADGSLAAGSLADAYLGGSTGY